LTNPDTGCGMQLVSRPLRNLAAVLLSLSLGLHWAVLQSVGWATMLVERSRAGSWEQAVQSTFSGKDPCGICKLVSEGQRAGEDCADPVSFPKLEVLGQFIPSFIPVAPRVEPFGSSECKVPPRRPVMPSLPPPRFV